MLGLGKMTHAGTGKVISCTIKGGLNWSSTDSRGRSMTTFDVILDVVPEGAPPFRAETHHRFSPLRFPDPGDTLRVRCNPDKKAVEIDISDDARFNPKIFRKENERKLKEDHDRLLHAPPGTPPTSGAGDLDPELAELMRRDEEERKQNST